MSQTIAVVAAGGMGAAVGARLAARGATVLTSVAGRSAASVERARAAGMQPVDDDALVAADLFLSIVPPNQAVALAERIGDRCRAAGRDLLYVDLNAVSPRTAARTAEIIVACGASFVDGGIIGAPPRGDVASPTFYVSGPAGSSVEILNAHGLVAKHIEGGVGAASALKMSYAGITKGLIALGAAMALAAMRGGVDAALLTELGASQAELLARFRKAVPDMLPKAYRWVPEMQEIVDFIGADLPESQIFEGVSAFYARIAADMGQDRHVTDQLERFFALPG